MGQQGSKRQESSNEEEIESVAWQQECLTEHEESVNCMCLSEDHSLLITASEDSTARLWSAQTAQTECLGVLRGHRGYINALAVLDTCVMTGASDGTIRSWDITTCECLHIFEGHASRIHKIAAAPPSLLVSSSHDKTARIWTLRPTEDNSGLVRVLVGHTAAVHPVLMIVNGGVSGDRHGISAGDLVVTGSADCTARIWAMDTGACLKVLKGHEGTITALATDNNARFVFTAASDAAIKSWNIATGQLLRTMEGVHTQAVLCLTVSPSRLLYSGSTDGTAACWVTEFGDCTRTFRGHRHSVVAIKFHRGILYTACGDGVVRAFDAKSGALRRSFAGHKSAVNCMAVTGNKLFTGSTDSSIRVWDNRGISDEMVPMEESTTETHEATLTSLEAKLEAQMKQIEEEEQANQAILDEIKDLDDLDNNDDKITNVEPVKAEE